MIIIINVFPNQASTTKARGIYSTEKRKINLKQLVVFQNEILILTRFVKHKYAKYECCNCLETHFSYTNQMSTAQLR